jgi:hypothetical protein
VPVCTPSNSTSDVPVQANISLPFTMPIEGRSVLSIG